MEKHVKIILMIVVPIVVLILSLSFQDNDGDKVSIPPPTDNIVDDSIGIPKPTSTPIPPQTGLGFSVNVAGDMHDKSYFTVSGTIPDEPNHLTGTIRTGEGDDLTIVYVFQIELDDKVNQYKEKVGVFDDYLWQEGATYIVSVNHGEMIKEVEFYRGTAQNDFKDSIVPLI